MQAILIAPRKYVQGRGVLGEAGPHIARLGKKPLVLWDARVRKIVGERVLASLKAAGLEVIDVDFRGDSTRAEAARVADIARTSGADIAVGGGGGKTLDTAKAAATKAPLPCHPVSAFTLNTDMPRPHTCAAFTGEELDEALAALGIPAAVRP